MSLTFQQKIALFGGGAKKSNNRNPEQKKDNPDKIIGKIGNLELHAFQKDNVINPKNILFLGNAQECFINTFINIYRSIEMKDEFRHKIDIKNIKAIKTSYDISSFDDSDYIRVLE